MMTGTWGLPRDIRISIVGAVENVELIVPVIMQRFSFQSKLGLSQILDLIFYWSQSLDIHKYSRRYCHFASESTIADWKSMTPEICTLYCLKYLCVIGGLDHVVEIDESMWTKRKYNKGRKVNSQWVFGSIDRDTKNHFAVLVDRRDAATLLPIIEKFILRGTTIYSDQ